MSPTLRQLSVMLLLVVCSGTSRTQSFTSPHFRTEQLAPGVYAAIATDNGSACANAGIVDLGGRTLVFDTFISPDAARDLLSAAEQLTHHPVTYVVNSHFHNDHIRGNQVFPSDVQIISTTKTFEEISRVEPEQIKWEIQNITGMLVNAQEALDEETDYYKRRELILQLAYCKAISGSQAQLKTRLPNVTFEKKLVLQGTTRTVEILQIGGGHTPGDCILLLPNEHIAFVGDLISTAMHPYMLDGSPEEWKATLEQMETLPIGTVVPGHGPVGNRIEISGMIDYIVGLEKLVSDKASLWEKDPDFLNEPVPSQYQAWQHTKNFDQNLRFLYDRVRLRVSR